MTNTRKILGVALLTLAAASFAVQDAITLKRTAKVGDTASYRLRADIDLAGQSATFTAVVNDKVTKVDADGTFTTESQVTQGKAVFAGQEMPMDDQPPTTTVTRANGEVVSVSNATDSSAMRMANLQSFRTPAGPVKIGEAWKVEIPANATAGTPAVTGEAKIVGQEMVGAFDTYKIEFNVKESEGSEPAGSTGTVWVSKADLSMVKYEATWTNAPFPGAPGPINAKVTIERN